MRLLQSGTAFRYYKVRSVLLQSGTGITKWDNYYKVGFNTEPANLISAENIF